MPVVRRKAFAYITTGQRLLLFTHPEHPEAGIQVPAGTLRDGEDPVAGALREAEEETGLSGLRVAGVIGGQRYDMRPFGADEFHDRTFVHLVLDDPAPETWIHGEFDPSDAHDDGRPIPFAFFWVDLPDGVPPLIADHDRFVVRLIGKMANG